MFPPGNAPADVAIAEHLRHRGAWYADLIGPLLIAAPAWAEFVAAHEARGRPDLSVVLIGTTADPEPVPAGVTLVGFEARVPDLPLPAIAPGRSFAAEVTADAAGERVLEAVGAQAASGAPVVAKFRTGGVEASAFPSEDTLAYVLRAASAAGARLKFTAGLHHAVRHRDPRTGFEHHGFLNVLVAAQLAARDAFLPDIPKVLAERDPERLVAAAEAMFDERAAPLGRAMVSFGCCGVEDPVGDLEALGVIDPRVGPTQEEKR